jgi:chitinase
MSTKHVVFFGESSFRYLVYILSISLIGTYILVAPAFATTIINTATFSGTISSTTLFPSISVRAPVDITYLKGLDYHVQWSNPSHNGYIAMSPSSEVTLDLGQTDNTVVMTGVVSALSSVVAGDTGNVAVGHTLKITANLNGYPFSSTWTVQDLTNGASMTGPLSSQSIQYFTQTTDTTAPSTSFSQPSSGATVIGSQPVNIFASDNIGVTKVEFYVDGALKSSLTTANGGTNTYSFTWDSTKVTNGSHTLMSKAYDAAGNVGTSSITVSVSNTVTVTDTTAPTVSISAPTAGSYLNTLSPSIKGAASDNIAVSKVQVSIDNGAYVTATGTTSWSYSASLSQATHTIKVQSTDTSGLVSSTVSDTFTIDTTAPTAPKITSPVTGTTTSSTTITIAGTAEAYSTVSIYDGSTLKSSIAASSTGTFSTTVSLLAGSHSITAKSTDKAGNASPPSTAVSLTISSTTSTTDTIAPTVSITSPAANSWQRGTITVSVSATDNIAVSSVQLYIDGVLFATDTSSPYSFSIGTTGRATGGHVLKAVAIDTSKNQASVQITINVDNTPPSLTVPSSITAQATSISGAKIGFSVSASDNVGISTITCTPSSGATFPVGTSTVTCTAKDLAGNTVTKSFSITVIDSVPPTVSIISPTSGSTLAGSATISIAATDNTAVARVEVYIDGSLSATLISSPYSYTIAKNGPHTVYAKAYDKYGNSAISTSIQIKVTG